LRDGSPLSGEVGLGRVIDLLGLVEVGPRRNSAVETKSGQPHAFLGACCCFLVDLEKARIRGMVEPGGDDVRDEC
jgi:hypothetical protein